MKKPSLQGNGSTDEDTKLCCNIAKASVFSFDRLSNCLGSPLSRLTLSGATIHAKLGTKHWYALHDPQIDFRFIISQGGVSCALCLHYARRERNEQGIPYDPSSQFPS